MQRVTKTENGLVRGTAAGDPRITVFKGVPFAAPPVGTLRWRAPQPANNWSGVRECLEFQPIAMQKTPGENPDAFYSKEWHVDPQVPMDEDCLYLNIWTSAKTFKEKMPVMVWIYGGGLMEGYPYEMEFDGERIARRDVILVSVNYRVNVFGFMTHPEIIASNPDGLVANFGFLDQKAGIDWVRRDISDFGGDPENITIFGQSAGGGSVLAHVNSPMAKGAFAKAIVQSGGGVRAKKPFRKMLTSLSLPELAEQGKAFFDFIGAGNLAEAKAIDGRTILAKHLEFGKYWSSTLDGKYCVEDSSESVLNGHQNKMPMMIGSTTGESLFTPPDENIEAWARENIPGIAADFCKMAREKAAAEDISLKQAATVFASELTASLFCETVAAQAGSLPAYTYSFGPEMPGDNAGAFHSSDLWFEFETLAKCWRPFTAKHYDLSRQMCNYWTNFAKKGDPNGLDADGKPMPKWTPYTLESPLVMELFDQPGMEKEQSPMKKLLLEYNKWLLQ